MNNIRLFSIASCFCLIVTILPSSAITLFGVNGYRSASSTGATLPLPARPNGVPGGIYSIDTITGKATLIGPTAPQADVGQFSSPNGIAYDSTNKLIYYSDCGGAGNSTLYCYNKNAPANTNPNRVVGALVGQCAAAGFYNGCYWYVPQGTATVKQVIFSAPGVLGSIVDHPLSPSIYLPSGNSLGFGGIAIDPSGIMYLNAGNTSAILSGISVLYQINLNATPMIVTSTVAWGDQSGQIALDSSGILYGVRTIGGIGAVSPPGQNPNPLAGVAYQQGQIDTFNVSTGYSGLYDFAPTSVIVNVAGAPLQIDDLCVGDSPVAPPLPPTGTLTILGSTAPLAGSVVNVSWTVTFP